MIEPLKKRLDIEFDDAVKKIETLMYSEGFIVMATKAIDESIKKNSEIENYPRYTIILGCNPVFAKAALDISVDSGLVFPCSFTVFEENGNIFAGHISTMKIISELNLADREKMVPVIKAVGESVKKIWDQL